MQALILMVLSVPSAQLKEYAQVFEEKFDVRLTESQICQLIAKHGINRKKVYILITQTYTKNSSKKRRKNVTLSYAIIGLQSWLIGVLYSLSLSMNQGLTPSSAKESGVTHLKARLFLTKSPGNGRRTSAFCQQ